MRLEQRSAEAWLGIDSKGIQRDLEDVRQVAEISARCGLPKTVAALKEFIALFDGVQIPEGRAISEMRDFLGAFGRGQQYLSLIRA